MKNEFTNLLPTGFFRKPVKRKTKAGTVISRQGKSLLKLVPKEKTFAPMVTENKELKGLFTRTVKSTPKFYTFDYKGKKEKTIRRVKIRKRKKPIIKDFWQFEKRRWSENLTSKPVWDWWK